MGSGAEYIYRGIEGFGQQLAQVLQRYADNRAESEYLDQKMEGIAELLAPYVKQQRIGEDLMKELSEFPSKDLNKRRALAARAEFTLNFLMQQDKLSNALKQREGQEFTPEQVEKFKTTLSELFNRPIDPTTAQVIAKYPPFARFLEPKPEKAQSDVLDKPASDERWYETEEEAKTHQKLFEDSGYKTTLTKRKRSDGKTVYVLTPIRPIPKIEDPFELRKRILQASDVDGDGVLSPDEAVNASYLLSQQRMPPVVPGTKVPRGDEAGSPAKVVDPERIKRAVEGIDPRKLLNGR